MWRLRAAYLLGASPESLARAYGYGAPPPEAEADVAILAKAPLAGYSKTRLAPLLGPVGAARAQRAFAIAAVHTALAARTGRVTLWAAPSAAGRFFGALRRRHATLQWADQPEGDLGARMGAMLVAHFEGARQPAPPLMIMGTDCPVLAPGHLRACARALRTHDAVLVPAEDGGYVLLGLARALPAVFDGIAWSTPQVAEQTRAALRASGARWTELEPLWDVDEPADWLRWRALASARA